MTQHATSGTIPHLTLGWRMKMALGETSVQYMADQLGVSRATVSRWMADKGAPPKKAYLRQWALATGVDYRWLSEGLITRPQPDPITGGSEVTAEYSPFPPRTVTKIGSQGVRPLPPTVALDLEAA